MDKAKSKVTGLRASGFSKPSGTPEKVITSLRAKSSVVGTFSTGKKTLKAKGK